MAPKVVVSRQLSRLDEIVQGLAAAGCTPVLGPASGPGAVPVHDFSSAEIQEYFADADAFIAGIRERYPKELLQAATRLTVGCSTIIGTEHIDVDAATELGIVIGFGATPENYLGVAEAVVMLAAALLKRLPQKWAAMREGAYRVSPAGQMVRHRTVGMIGLGNVGQAVARRLAGWECRLVATDPYVSKDVAADLGVELMDLETLLGTSDVVSIQVVLTGETRHLLGSRELALMKPGAYLINTSRGGVVDEDALVRALDSHLGGAALDVWREEPCPPGHPLRTHPGVIATAHNVAHSEELYARLPGAAVENVVRALGGREPLYVRNPEVIPRWRARLARLGGSPLR
jgi:D-3-phosphoglycerate dehydrogenase / 2-oxoglutarate reductase